MQYKRPLWLCNWQLILPQHYSNQKSHSTIKQLNNFHDNSTPMHHSSYNFTVFCIRFNLSKSFLYKTLYFSTWCPHLLSPHGSMWRGFWGHTRHRLCLPRSRHMGGQGRMWRVLRRSRRRSVLSRILGATGRFFSVCWRV